MFCTHSVPIRLRRVRAAWVRCKNRPSLAALLPDHVSSAPSILFPWAALRYRNTLAEQSRLDIFTQLLTLFV